MSEPQFSVTVSSSYGRHDADVVWALHSLRPEKRLAELAVLEANFLRALAVEQDRLHREINGT